ncbi:MAG: hypothetical protein AAFR04_16020 [Pseudomonadota bacterium]
MLARVAVVEGVARAELARDLQPYVAHRLAPGEWRDVLEQQIHALQIANALTLQQGRLRATEVGIAMVSNALGVRQPRAAATWPEQRAVRLMAWALGVAQPVGRRAKFLGSPEGLRAFVLVNAFDLKLKGAGQPTPAKLRAALATHALVRAFGSARRARQEIRDGADLSPQAARLLAGQLAQRPRDFGTDRRLVAVLAAEQVGAVQHDHGALQLALIRRRLDLVPPATKAEVAPATQPAPGLARDQTAAVGDTTSSPAPAAGVDRRAATSRDGDASATRQAQAITLDDASATVVDAAARPDLEQFAAQVAALAKTQARGWSGDRKAYISDVSQLIRERHAAWALSDIEFKAMLAAAHQAGLVALGFADLKDKSDLARVQASALSAKNAVWHYIRVED